MEKQWIILDSKNRIDKSKQQLKVGLKQNRQTQLELLRKMQLLINIKDFKQKESKYPWSANLKAKIKSLRAGEKEKPYSKFKKIIELRKKVRMITNSQQQRALKSLYNMN
ncbi:unnamed protein product (macronuclear) [Paramecium tetraurelia]|uniref:Ribosomal protein L29 n=1 Tax=Paramecium tetraurelia TaxID=5888 RepID=A0BK67_PARTE|nr:uncharacterized protein GSPATT00029564001 [Paramecium tetraurelia]CAK58934.1 unnamed protein product [Paramecium tetraurelia]|eukprot:XP_001426332.1 hypothetical protein (macronuclear) [Paramecium tetraurelia strain d4-2]